MVIIIRIKDIPKEERPRERLLKVGKENLSNEELLSIIIKTGTYGISVNEIASNVLKEIQNINNLENITVNSFSNDNTKYNNPEVIYLNNKYLFKGKKQEYFYCLYLDNKNKLIERKLLFMGTINRSVVHPREIFKEAYLSSCSSIVCMHNHPSGDINPSMEDIYLTKSLVKIGKIQGINVVDHVIFGDNNYYSFYDNNKDLFL